MVRGVFERRCDIVVLQIRIVSQYVAAARTGSKHVENVLDPDPQAADAGVTSEDVRIDSNSIEVTTHSGAPEFDLILAQPISLI